MADHRCINLMPGSVEIECTHCRLRLRGCTAASVMQKLRDHLIVCPEFCSCRKAVV